MVTIKMKEKKRKRIEMSKLNGYHKNERKEEKEETEKKRVHVPQGGLESMQYSRS